MRQLLSTTNRLDLLGAAFGALCADRAIIDLPILRVRVVGSPSDPPAKMSRMLIPVLIFGVCFCAGVGAAARWLPSLAEGAVGGLAFFLVCGLLGAALGLVGLHIYSIVEALDTAGGGFGGIRKGFVMAEELQSLLFEAGLLLGLTFVVYLLAPPAETDDEPVAPPAV
jgi:hypothetical protein